MADEPPATDGREIDDPRPRPGAMETLVQDPRALVPLLLVVDSLHYVFARLLLSHLPPAASSLYMLGIATIQVAILTRGCLRLAVLRRHWLFFTTIGLLVAVNTNIGFLAVKFVDPGTAALLSRTSVIFGVGLGLVWLEERLDRIEVAGAALALAGAIVVSFQPGDYLRLGALLVVIATFLYALHSAVVKRYGGQIAFAEFFFFRLAGTTAFLIFLAAAQGALVWPPATAWPLLLLAATVNIVISRGLYYLALRRLEMSFLTIILTLSPVVTVMWSMALFGGRPSLAEIIGGIAILAGVMVVSANRGGYLRASTPPGTSEGDLAPLPNLPPGSSRAGVLRAFADSELGSPSAAPRNAAAARNADLPTGSSTTGGATPTHDRSRPCDS